MSALTDGLRRTHLSDRLRHRRLETLPLTGPGAVFTDIQGRGPGESTRPAALADLISTISDVGVLQPVLVEETHDPTGAHLRLVLGERRLRACRWGAAEAPENPHFSTIPAVICPGPLSDEDIRAWQLIENLAREPLQPGELAEALLLERCAMLVTRLLSAGIPVPAAVLHLDNPVQRWNALNSLRPSTGPHANLGAAWHDVISRLGLHLTDRKARLLVEAFSALPRDISTDMDAHRIALTSRCRYAQLFRGGRDDAARSLWDALRDRGAAGLLPAAVTAMLTDPTLTPDAAAEAADHAAGAADLARAAALTKLDTTDPAIAPRAASDHAESPENHEEDYEDDLVDEPRELTRPEVPASLVSALRSALDHLLDSLRCGAQLARFDTGSLALQVAELEHLAGLSAAAPRRGDGHRRARSATA